MTSAGAVASGGMMRSSGCRTSAARKHAANHQRGQPGAAALFRAGGGFDVARDGRSAERAPTIAAPASAVSARPIPATGLLIEQAEPRTDADQRAHVIEEIDEEKCEDQRQRLAGCAKR